MSDNLGDLSLFDLFRMEAEEQVQVLQNGLMALDGGDVSAANLESLMRAAHSIKGAARIVGLDTIVQLTHVVEDRFVAAQQGHTLSSDEVTQMLAATDWLSRLQAIAEAEVADWLQTHTASIVEFTKTLAVQGATAPPATPSAVHPAAVPDQEEAFETDVFARPTGEKQSSQRRDVRIAAERFDHILALASETLVASRTLSTQAERLERQRKALERTVQVWQETQASSGPEAGEIGRLAVDLAAGIADFDRVARLHHRVAEGLYRDVIAGRLRPFEEGVRGAHRLVRNTARDLGKQVRLEVLGERTQVDRDILERLEAPISHLIANAIDHGIETSLERSQSGKPAEARLLLHARHDNGRLVISLEDDGRGIDPEALRTRIVSRGLTSELTASGLTTPELMEFLFLPGFSTRDEISEISGRGVGLNVVQSMVHEAGGSVVVRSVPKEGTTFRLTLPVTRSVIRVIRFRIDGEMYAMPLVHIDKVVRVNLQRPDGEDGRPVAILNGAEVPVFALANLLGFSSAPMTSADVQVILCSGVCFSVDEFVDETELPVWRLDARLGKIPGVSATSLDEHGNPLLILDVGDLVQTAMADQGQSRESAEDGLGAATVLVVDDSHTVREIVRRSLVKFGYRVRTAQNGQEAWNLLRLSEFDLLVSDVDMPQMNGIELVSLVRANPRLGRLPVIMLSYKDRAEDRARGLEAGADYYLTKGDFDNENFRQAVVDLIGAAKAAE
jgi:two-component system sensor histidine kinase and response regulator WspE